MSARTLYSAGDIAARVEAVAAAIAAAPARPEVAVPVLTGAFVFAADLLRALYRHGVDLAVEPLWLASYGMAQTAGSVTVKSAPNIAVHGRHVLVIDGVLDSGRTLMVARELLFGAGACQITTAVAIDKRLPIAPLIADYACFCDCRAFVVGYGMDDAGHGRGRPEIAAIQADATTKE